GRYKELKPVFYVPNRERKLVQVGKTGAYQFEDGTDEQYVHVINALQGSAVEAFDRYKFLLEQGVAKEVARMVLPLNIYSSVYITVNARSLMNFISLRTNRDDARYPSKPQREIEMVAEKMEEIFAEKMPLVYKYFNEFGRVSP